MNQNPFNQSPLIQVGETESSEVVYFLTSHNRSLQVLARKLEPPRTEIIAKIVVHSGTDPSVACEDILTSIRNHSLRIENGFPCVTGNADSIWSIADSFKRFLAQRATPSKAPASPVDHTIQPIDSIDHSPDDFL